MTYLDYVVFFEKCDQQQPKGFSGNATRLYLKLLAIANQIANGGSWPAEFAKSNPYLAGVCNFSINTMKDCRSELVAAGLIAAIDAGNGRNAATTYKLLNPSKSDELPTVNPSNFDTLPVVNPSNSDGFSAKTPVNPSENPSNFDTLYKEEEKEVVEAASAAAPAPLISEKSEIKPKRGAAKPKGATLEEVAALPLPFEGAEFAETWRTFYTDNPKQVQAAKPLSAFELMLKKLANYPEAFAVAMVEKAIMGNWQGIENGGTARDFADWQQQQAAQPKPAAPLSAEPEAPQMNQEFLAQQAAAAEARRAERLAELAA